MGFFEDFGKKVNKFGQDVATKTKNVSEITRLNSENSRTKRSIEDEYRNIGQKAYELSLKGEGYAKFKDEFQKIQDAFDLIAKNEEKILELKDITICPSCGAELDTKSAYCGTCGAKIDRPEKKPEEPAGDQPCKECGEMIPADSEFCPSCGAKK